MQTITPVPVIEDTLWILATMLFALFASYYVWAMVKEKELTKSMEPYGD